MNEKVLSKIKTLLELDQNADDLDVLEAIILLTSKKQQSFSTGLTPRSVEPFVKLASDLTETLNKIDDKRIPDHLKTRYTDSRK